jgi:hypothetical protein
MTISAIVQRLAHLTIVSNAALKDTVVKNGGRAFVLPDPLPILPQAPALSLEHKFNILYICTFADDEPYTNVFKAAERLGDAFHIYVTGNYKKRAIDPFLMPSNISLLGYVSETDFVKMIYSVDMTMDLTDRENCLVCGAYESAAAGKPMIITNTAALRQYFDKGAVYTDNSAQDIAASILNAKARYTHLKEEIQQLKSEKQHHWAELKENLQRQFIFRD